MVAHFIIGPREAREFEAREREARRPSFKPWDTSRFVATLADALRCRGVTSLPLAQGAFDRAVADACRGSPFAGFVLRPDARWGGSLPLRLALATAPTRCRMENDVLLFDGSAADAWRRLYGVAGERLDVAQHFDALAADIVARVEAVQEANRAREPSARDAVVARFRWAS